jgi:hypothetical protein
LFLFVKLLSRHKQYLVVQMGSTWLHSCRTSSNVSVSICSGCDLPFFHPSLPAFQKYLSIALHQHSVISLFKQHSVIPTTFTSSSGGSTVVSMTVNCTSAQGSVAHRHSRIIKAATIAIALHYRYEQFVARISSLIHSRT